MKNTFCVVHTDRIADNLACKDLEFVPHLFKGCALTESILYCITIYTSCKYMARKAGCGTKAR